MPLLKPRQPPSLPTSSSPAGLLLPGARVAQIQIWIWISPSAALLLLLLLGASVSLPLRRGATPLPPTPASSSYVQGPIRIPTIYSDVLEMVVKYREKHAPHSDPEASEHDRHPFSPFPVELPPTASAIKSVTYVDPHGLKPGTREFLYVDNSTLFEIILAANYLNVEDQLDLGCTMVADKMKGRMPEEIHDIFEIESDYTSEQEVEVRKENAWAFED